MTVGLVTYHDMSPKEESGHVMTPSAASWLRSSVVSILILGDRTEKIVDSSDG